MKGIIYMLNLVAVSGRKLGHYGSGSFLVTGHAPGQAAKNLGRHQLLYTRGTDISEWNLLWSVMHIYWIMIDYLLIRLC